MSKPNESRFVYVTYIRTTPELLWNALTAPEFMVQYWFGMHIETDWQQGSSWKLLFSDGRVADQGEVVEIDPPRRLALKWRNEWREEFRGEGEAFCIIELEPVNGAVKLTIDHSIGHAESQLIAAVSGGWPKIISNLKSLLETGKVAMEVMAGK